MSEKKKGKMLSTICDNAELPGKVRELILSHRFVNKVFFTVTAIFDRYDHFGRFGPFWTLLDH